MTQTGSALLEVRNVTRLFAVRGAKGSAPAMLRAVGNVSLSISRGECVGLVGESGCGKSTLGRLVCGLDTPTSGEVLLDGRPLPPAGPSSSEAGRIQMVFQDPFSSLNPRMRVGESVGEGLRTAGCRRRQPMSAAERREAVARVFDSVGLSGMESRYPHEFSGGQRQRVALARAFVTRPDLVVCDEPVSALDASVQAQVLNIMRDLQEELGQAQIFISHNLAVVRFMCSRLHVMYLGEIVEELDCSRLDAAAHPYTRALAAAMPSAGRGRGELVVLAGELPSPLSPPPGCRFHPRCPRAQDICTREEPAWKELAPGWRVRCHLA
ncbi:MAG: ABC transporter ATP-binding protein [Desulfovibrionaceae bacterium]|nr:ABC transporter ATP-binding protein [Desulfovibrionaceae bacterium]